MPLSQPILKAGILALLNDSLTKTTDTQAALNDFAEELSTLITDHIKTLTVTFPPGTIQVTGTAVAQANVAPVTGALIT